MGRQWQQRILDSGDELSSTILERMDLDQAPPEGSWPHLRVHFVYGGTESGFEEKALTRSLCTNALKRSWNCEGYPHWGVSPVHIIGIHEALTTMQ